MADILQNIALEPLLDGSPQALTNQVVFEPVYDGSPQVLAQQVLIETVYDGAPTVFVEQLLIEVLMPFQLAASRKRIQEFILPGG